MAQKNLQRNNQKISKEQTEFSSQVLKACKERLLSEKEEVLNTLKVNGRPPESEDTVGDFGDQNVRAINEHQWLLFQNRLRKQLFEVESALHRLESGTYGICEETEQLIEKERILALPWTRLSLEGAKLRESLQR
jgi:DnaK suppressor protein